MDIGGAYPWDFNQGNSNGTRLSTRNTISLDLDGMFYEFTKVPTTGAFATSSYSNVYAPSKVIDDYGVSGTSWSSWFSASSPSIGTPQELIIELGTGSLIDTFRWYYLDNFDRRQPFHYSLYYSFDGQSWLPVNNLNNGYYEPGVTSGPLLDAALDIANQPISPIGNRIQGNTNNATDRSEPRWITHTFSKVSAKKFKMVITASGGGYETKFGRRFAEFVGVTEVQFYNLSDAVEGMSTYFQDGFFETKVYAVTRADSFSYNAITPSNTAIKTFYRTCPDTFNLLVQPWLPTTATNMDIPYNPTEINTNQWIIQFRFEFHTDNIFITPELYWLKITSKTLQVIEGFATFNSNTTDKFETFRRNNDIDKLQTLEYESRKVNTYHEYKPEVQDAAKTIRIDAVSEIRPLKDTSVIDYTATLQTDVIDARAQYELGIIDKVDVRTTSVVDKVHNLDTIIVEERSEQLPEQLSGIEQLNPLIITGVSQQDILPIAALSEQLITPITGTHSETPTVIAGINAIDPTVIADVIGIEPLALVGFSAVDPEVLLGILDAEIVQLTGVSDVGTPYLVGFIPLELAELINPLSFDAKELVESRGLTIDNLPTSREYQAIELIGITSQEVTMFDRFIDFTTQALTGIKSFAASELQSPTLLSSEDLIASTTYDCTDLVNRTTDIYTEILTKPIVDLIMGEHVKAETFTLNITKDSYLDLFVDAHRGISEISPITFRNMVNLGEMANILDYMSLNMPVASKVIQVFSREKINLLPLTPINNSLENSFTISTQRNNPTPNLPPVLQVVGDMRELESPPITLGGLGVTLKYPYLPESWSGVSNIGLLMEHSRTDVKTIESNITVDWEAVVQDVVITENWTAMDYNFYHQLWLFYMERKHLKYRPKDLNTFEYLVEIVSISAQKQHKFWVNGVVLKLKVHCVGGAWTDNTTTSCPDFPPGGAFDPYRKNKIFPNAVDINKDTGAC
jgi:hypothetical protein